VSFKVINFGHEFNGDFVAINLAYFYLGYVSPSNVQGMDSIKKQLIYIL
jgi:hypothetical protein